MNNKYFINQNINVVQIFGKDSIDFLQRISTNDCNLLKNEKFITTCFLNDKGRLIDICNIFKKEDILYLTSNSTNFNKTIEHLNKYIITDEVEFKFVPTIYQLIITNYENVWENELVGFNKKLDAWICLLENGKIEKYFYGKKEKSIKEFNYQNIMNGIINVNELTIGKYNPLELNLKEYISFTKGCYLGQEIVARLDTYNKTTNHLAVLKNSNMANNFLGSEILDAEKNNCGRIISSQKYNEEMCYLAIVSNKIKDIEFYLNSSNTSFIKVKKIGLN